MSRPSIRSVATIFKDILLIELRGAEALWAVLGLALLFCALLALGAKTILVGEAALAHFFPLFFWFIFLAVTSIAIAKVCEADLAFDGLAGLLLAGIVPASIYAARAAVVFLLSILALLVIALFLLLFLELPPIPRPGAAIFVGISAAFGYSCLATLLALATASARLKTVLLPLVLLPLSFPLFFCALELSARVLAEHGPLTFAPWLALLWGLNLIYLALGLLLADPVIRG